MTDAAEGAYIDGMTEVLPEGKVFKGWAVPGPSVPGEGDPELGRAGEGESLDALSGRFKIFQLRDGHRFSTDDLLVAWYGTSVAPAAARVLDLGSGIGSVGMIAAWRLQRASFVTVEAQEASVALARRSARHNGLAGPDGRYEIRQGDFRSGVLREGEKFDLVLGSPPYFPLEAGIHGDHPQKIACRFEVRGSIADYCLTASRHLAPGAFFACVFPIHPEHQLERARQAAREAGLTIVRMRPVALKEGEPPLLGLFAMVRSGDLPESMRAPAGFYEEPALVIRRRDGSIHPEYSVAKMAIGFHPL